MSRIESTLYRSVTTRGVLFTLGGVAVYFTLLTLMVHFESGSEDTNIHTLVDAVWYSMVTLTTVGYGDMYPQTFGGRIIGYIFVLASLGVLGFLVGKISALFTEMSENKRLGYHGTSFTEHVVIVGWNSFAQTVTAQMLAAGVKVAVVTDSRNDVDLLAEEYDGSELFVLFASFTSMEIIEKANVDGSTAVFINLEDDAQTLVFLLNCRKHFSKRVQYGVVLNNGELKPTFENAGASIVVCMNELCSQLIASYIFEPHVAQFTEDLIASAVAEDDFDIQQFFITHSNPFKGQSYESTFFEVKKVYDAILIGLTSFRTGARVLHKTPNDPTLTVEEGDYLILIVSGQNVEQITKDFGVTEGYHENLEHAALKTV